MSRHIHFTQSLEPLQGGGLGSSALALHRRFLAAGLASTLCATCGDETQPGSEQVMEFHRVKPGPLYFAPELSRRAPDLVADADVLHGHGLYVGTNYVFGREARRQAKPLVYHVHGMFEPYILGRSRWKKQLVHWLFENDNFRCVRLWRALTAKEAGQIRARGITAPIVIAPNGLDLEDYAAQGDAGQPIETPLVPRLAKTRNRLLFLGRIHPKKGLDLLTTAWAALGPGRNEWELVVAGPDENGHLGQVRKLAATLGGANEISFTGPVTGRAKIALLHSADVFVLPSYSEGFPMSLLEALACGVPVVASTACNFPEAAAAGAGWECETTAESVAGALRKAMREDSAGRAQRGRTGRSLVAERYAWPAIVETLVQACAAHC